MRWLQTQAALGPWPSLRLVPPTPCQGRGQARLRVYMYRGPLRSAVVLRRQTGLTANLQGFRIRAQGGMAPLAAPRERWICGTGSRVDGSSGTSWVAMIGRQINAILVLGRRQRGLDRKS